MTLAPIENRRVRGKFACLGDAPLSTAEKQRRYRARHPEVRAHITSRKMARKYGVENTLKVGEWRDILARYDYRCAYCFAPYEVLEHAVPMIRGGGNTKENVVPACAECNRSKDFASTGWVPSVASEFWPHLAEELYA